MKEKRDFYGCEGSYLFSKEEMYSRKKISQSEFEESILGVSDQIVSACYDGFSDYFEFSCLHRGAARMRNFAPTVINSFIAEKLMKSLQDKSGFDSDRRFYLLIGGSKLFLKKVDVGFKPQNIRTKNVGMYDYQLSVSGQDFCPITYIGYQVNESYSEIKGVYAIHYENGSISWISDVEYLESKSNEIISLNYLNDNAENDVSVAVKGGEQRKAE